MKIKLPSTEQEEGLLLCKISKGPSKIFHSTHYFENIRIRIQSLRFSLCFFHLEM